MSGQRIPLWLYPNLLSLDAPLVAVSWLWVFSRIWRADYLPMSAYWALGLAVWSIYIFDRLFDASMRRNSPARLEERHRYHLKHRRLFSGMAVVAAFAALVLTLVALPMQILSYSAFGGMLLVAFFAMGIFSTRGVGEVEIGKNLIAGFTFAYGTALAAHVHVSAMDSTGLRFLDLAKNQQVLTFAALCILNIMAIDLWESSRAAKDQEVRANAELSVTLPLALLGMGCLYLAWREETTIRPFYYSVLFSAMLMYILNRMRSQLSPDLLRVLADVALVIPVPIFAVLEYAP